MFKCLVQFKGQEPQLFGIPNVAHVSALASMDNVEWVAGPFGDNGTLLDVHNRISTSLLGEKNVRPVIPAVKVEHFCPTHPTGVLTPRVMSNVMSFIQKQQKISAIKEVRAATSWTLKDTKDFVDFLCAATTWSPSPF